MFQIITIMLVSLFMSSITHSFEIQGHRGARGVLPENTLAAFSAAIEAGANGIEMDLLMTQDDEIVIYHDFIVNSKLCTYLDGSAIREPRLIREMTLLEVKEIDCGRVQNPLFPRQKSLPGTTIPTLKELFNFIQSSKQPNAKTVFLNLEIKADPIHRDYTPPLDKLAQEIIRVVQESGFESRIYYSSFDFDLLSEIRKIDNKTPIGLIFDKNSLMQHGVNPADWVGYILDAATNLQAKIISPNYKLLTPDNIQTMHAGGLRIMTWTINDIQRGRQLMEMGVDGIATDFPKEMIEELKSEIR